jgi:hypothetical protein
MASSKLGTLSLVTAIPGDASSTTTECAEGELRGSSVAPSGTEARGSIWMMTFG